MTDSSAAIDACAEACGVPVQLARNYVWAYERYLAMDEPGHQSSLWWAVESAWAAIGRAVGGDSVTALQERLEAAIMDGSLPWPFPEWKRAIPLSPQRVFPGRIEDDEPDIEPAFAPGDLEVFAEIIGDDLSGPVRT